MRTTIDDRLLRAAKRLAAARGVTLSEVVTDALRQQLAAAPTRTKRPFKLVTFQGNGVRSGIDLDRTSTLEELDDLDRFRRASR